jgi:hypothetical protein
MFDMKMRKKKIFYNNLFYLNSNKKNYWYNVINKKVVNNFFWMNSKGLLPNSALESFGNGQPPYKSVAYWANGLLSLWNLNLVGPRKSVIL